MQAGLASFDAGRLRAAAYLLAQLPPHYLSHLWSSLASFARARPDILVPPGRPLPAGPFSPSLLVEVHLASPLHQTEPNRWLYFMHCFYRFSRYVRMAAVSPAGSV